MACSLPWTWPGTLALLAASGVVRRRVPCLGGLLRHHRCLRLLGDLLETLPGTLGRGAGRLGHPVLAAPPAVRECELGGGGGVGGGHDQAVVGVGGDTCGSGAHQLLGLVPGADGPCGAGHHDVGAVSERAGVDAHERDEPADGRRDHHPWEEALRLLDDRLEVILAGEKLTLEPGTVDAPMCVALHDAHPLVEVPETGDVDAEPESIEELRTEVSLLGVHRPHQDEARRVRERDALALDRVPPHRRSVEEHVDDVVVEQIDLVDVEDAAVCVGEEPRLEVTLAELDRRLGVDGADHPILGCVDRQFDHARAAVLDRASDPGLGAGATVVAPRRRGVRITSIPASDDHVDIGKQPGERADSGGLGGATLTADEHTADPRVDGVEDQRGLHGLLTHESGERHEGTRVRHRTHCGSAAEHRACYKASMQRPLRVLLEASCLGDGRRDAGIGRYASQLIEALRDTPGLEVTPSVPATPAWSEARPARFLRAQPHVLSRRSRQASTPGPRARWRAGDRLSAVSPGGDAARRRDVARRAGSGVAVSARRLFGAFLAPTIRACAGIIAVSETTRIEAIATLDLDPSRIHVVPHGVGAVFSARPKLRDARTAEALGLDEPFVLWVGSLRSRDPRKGLDTLLQAMERLPGGGPPLALVGALGPEADRLAADAWRRRLRLVLSGAVDDVELASLYRQAAVVVLPSTHEGFGLTALEAMACGAPLVASAVGNLP